MSRTVPSPDRPFSPLLFIQPAVIQILQIIGLALIAVSIVYLLAANWWMLPKFVQLFIPQILLLGSALLSVRFTAREKLRQSLDTVSGLMLGLSLAVIGQIYQTGADSYQLFLLWALLLLPWLYRPNIGIFALFCVVSQLALYFYFKQSFWLVRAETLYLLGLNLLTGLSMIYALRYYPVLRYLFIAVVVLISVVSMFRFIDSDSISYLASVLVLPILFSAYFYTRKQQLETSLLVAGLALSFSIFIFDLTKQYLQDSAAGLLVLALLIFSWFASITGLLIKLLPKSRFSVIPLALGAWIAGVILAMLLLTYWERFSILMGIIFIAVAWWLFVGVRSGRGIDSYRITHREPIADLADTSRHYAVDYHESYALAGGAVAVVTCTYTGNCSSGRATCIFSGSALADVDHAAELQHSDCDFDYCETLARFTLCQKREFMDDRYFSGNSHFSMPAAIWCGSAIAATRYR